MTYQQQIRDPRWQKKRLQVLNLHKFKCQSCGCKTEELHVHHPYYKRGAMIWEYDKSELECLCHRCHKEAHAIDEKIKRLLAVCKDKHKVFQFILSLNGGVIDESPRQNDPRPLTEQEKEDAEITAALDLLPPEERTPEAFFARMKRMFG